MKILSFKLYFALILLAILTIGISCADSSEGEGSSSVSKCAAFDLYSFGEFKLENNLWNASSLKDGSYSQCVTWNTDNTFSWKWSFPSTAAPKVYAYPQVIYGFKPWQSPSTTSRLPKEISKISKLKVDFEVDMTISNDFYNLAFDNWICSGTDITPANILFEFMIWEDYGSLTPFGNYHGTVTTSNGDYDLYTGEPDWEPAGSNWTYIAFVRKDKRRAGTVDIDELMDYLINEGIIKASHVLASIEFGNELGNNSGETKVKKFSIAIE